MKDCFYKGNLIFREAREKRSKTVKTDKGIPWWKVEIAWYTTDSEIAF